MWEFDHQEVWASKNWCFLTAVLETTLESPLDRKEIKPGNPKGKQSWYSLEGLMLKFQYFGHLMWRVNSLEMMLILGRLRAGGEGGDRGWDGWWHHWLSGHEFQQILGDSEVERETWRTAVHEMGSQRVSNNWATEQQIGNHCNHPLVIFWLTLMWFQKILWSGLNINALR